MVLAAIGNYTTIFMSNEAFYVLGDVALRQALVTKLEGYKLASSESHEKVLGIYPRDKQYSPNLYDPTPGYDHYTLPQDWDKVLERLKTKVEYVKSLRDYPDNFTKNKIYKVGGKYNREDQFGILCDDEGVENGQGNEYWEPSTKAAYEEQERIKIGDYVICIPGYSNSYGITYGGYGYRKGRAGKVKEVDENQIVWLEGGGPTGGIHLEAVRKATPQEIEASKTITIHGHKAECLSGSVRFGCQELSKTTIQELLNLSKVTAINIAGEDITTYLLTKILNRI